MRKLIIGIIFFLLSGATLLQAQYNTDLSKGIFLNHRGEILFSEHEIDLKNHSEKDLQNNFEMSDAIYAQVILKKTLAQSYKDNNYKYDFNSVQYSYNYALQLFVDGERKAQWFFELPEEYFNNVLSFDLTICSNDPIVKRKSSEFIMEYVEAISTLEEGKRKIRLDVIPVNTKLIGDVHPVLASGTFTLNVQRNRMEDFMDKKTPGIPPVTLVNKLIEDKILSASDNIYPFATPIKVFITDVKQDWSYAIDVQGNIASRQIIASVAYRINTSGQCWIKTGYYSQKHQGYGDFGPMEYYKETKGYYNYRIPCRKVIEK